MLVSWRVSIIDITEVMYFILQMFSYNIMKDIYCNYIACMML